MHGLETLAKMNQLAARKLKSDQCGRDFKIKPRFTTGTDHACFDCVWKGAWYRLASGARHRKKNIGVPGSPQPDVYILLDSLSRESLAPKSEVYIRQRI